MKQSEVYSTSDNGLFKDMDSRSKYNQKVIPSSKTHNPPLRTSTEVTEGYDSEHEGLFV